MSTGKSCILCPRKRCPRCFSSSFLLPSLVCPSWDKAFTLDELSEQSAFSPGQDKHPSLPDKFSQVTEAQTLLTFYSCQRDVIWTRETSLEASQASPGPSPISEVISELICSSPAALVPWAGPPGFPKLGSRSSPWDAAFPRCPLMELPVVVAVLCQVTVSPDTGKGRDPDEKQKAAKCVCRSGGQDSVAGRWRMGFIYSRGWDGSCLRLSVQRAGDRQV